LLNAWNVTAVAGPDGIAARAWANTGTYTILALFNTIARGGSDDLEAASIGNPGGTAVITPRFSNFDPAHTSSAGGGSIAQGQNNQSAAPVFTGACRNDFHEAKDSPTVDAGMDDPATGDRDIDGDPRKIGATDIGADELVPPGPADPCAPPSAEPSSAPTTTTPMTPPRDLTAPAFVSASARVRRHRVTLRYRLSEPARVAFTVRRCGRKCKRVGRLSQQGHVGLNSKRWQRKLKAGRYRALLVATDSAGNRSRVTQLGFRVRR
jgi:hypothetical protein